MYFYHIKKRSSICSLIGSKYMIWLQKQKCMAKPKEIIALEHAYCIDIEESRYTISDGKITYLNLSECNIIDISPLKVLEDLTFLNLSYNQISDVRGLSSLIKLTYLHLSYNQISDISGLSPLIKLTDLHLSNNQISDVSALSPLLKLTSLNLSNNQISDVSALSPLLQLTDLNLANNQISDVSALAPLLQLTDLNLANNQISDVSGLAPLLQLTSLNLLNNQISDIRPLEIFILKGLEVKIIEEVYLFEGINIFGCPLTKPPIEIVEQGSGAILAYFVDLEEKEIEQSTKEITHPLNEIRVIIIGKGKIGKTTLKKRLLGQEVSADENQTDGIDIHTWTPESLENIKIRLWDFGGQEIQHGVHKLFLQDNCIYLLVLDKRQDQQYNKDIVYWMDHIRSFGGNSPIIIVENCIDTILNKDQTYTEDEIAEIITLNAEIENHYKEKDKPVEIVGVSALYDINMDALQKKLFKYVKIENNKGQYLQEWLNAKGAVESSITGGIELDGLAKTNYITRETYGLLCDNAKVKSEESKIAILGVMIRLGVAFYFKSKNQNWLILNPEWVTVAMYTIILDPKVKSLNGLITKQDVFDIMDSKKEKKYFSKKQYSYTNEEVEYILSLMRDYELCYTPDDNEYYFPLGFNNNFKSNFKTTYADHLTYTFDYENLPKSLWYKLVTRLQKRKVLDRYWQSGIEVSNEGVKALVELSTLTASKIQIFTEKNQGGKDLLELIRYELRYINEEFTNIKTNEKIVINEQEIPYQDLLSVVSKNNNYDVSFSEPIKALPALLQYDNVEYSSRNLIKELYEQNRKLGSSIRDMKAYMDNKDKLQVDFIALLASELQRGGPVTIIQNINQNYNQNVNINENRLELPHDINALEGKLNFIINELKDKDNEKEKIKEILESIEELRKIPTKEQAIKKGYFEKFKKMADYMKSGSDLAKALDNLKDYIDIDKIKSGIELILQTIQG